MPDSKLPGKSGLGCFVERKSGFEMQYPPPPHLQRGGFGRPFLNG